MSLNRVPLSTNSLHVAQRPLSPIRQRHKNSKEPYYGSSALDTCNLQSTHQLMSWLPFFLISDKHPYGQNAPPPGYAPQYPQQMHQSSSNVTVVVSARSQKISCQKLLFRNKKKKNMHKRFTISKTRYFTT